jgi:hypothetical protein
LCVFVAIFPALEQNLMFAHCFWPQRKAQLGCGVAVDELPELEFPFH